MIDNVWLTNFPPGVLTGRKTLNMFIISTLEETASYGSFCLVSFMVSKVVKGLEPGHLEKIGGERIDLGELAAGSPDVEEYILCQVVGRIFVFPCHLCQFFRSFRMACSRLSEGSMML